MKNTRYIQFSGKVSDMAFLRFMDESKSEIATKEGYVPSDLGIGGGDYVEFTLDVHTGKIVDWVRPSDAALDNAAQP